MKEADCSASFRCFQCEPAGPSVRFSRDVRGLPALTALAAEAAVAGRFSRCGDYDVAGLGALLAFADFEFDFVAFVEVAVAFTLDGGEVHEQIGTAVVLRNETVTFFTVEPLYFACRHSFSYPPAGFTRRHN